MAMPRGKPFDNKRPRTFALMHSEKVQDRLMTIPSFFKENPSFLKVFDLFRASEKISKAAINRISPNTVGVLSENGIITGLPGGTHFMLTNAAKLYSKDLKK